MDWKERLRHYSEGGTSSTMKEEDLAARSIVSGLCGNGSMTHALAARLGCMSDDATEFELAKAILDSVSGGMFHHASPARRFMLDVRKAVKACWKDDGELEELCEMSKAAPDGLIALSRVNVGKNKVACHAFLFLRDVREPAEYVMRPVSVLLAKCCGIAVWKREAKALFRDMRDVLKWEVPS